MPATATGICHVRLRLRELHILTFGSGCVNSTPAVACNFVKTYHIPNRPTCEGLFNAPDHAETESDQPFLGPLLHWNVVNGLDQRLPTDKYVWLGDHG